jgi:hypothetical protein
MKIFNLARCRQNQGGPCGFPHSPVFTERGIKSEDSLIERDLKSRETVSKIRLSMCVVLRNNIVMIDGVIG